MNPSRTQLFNGLLAALRDSLDMLGLLNGIFPAGSCQQAKGFCTMNPGLMQRFFNGLLAALRDSRDMFGLLNGIFPVGGLLAALRDSHDMFGLLNGIFPVGSCQQEKCFCTMNPGLMQLFNNLLVALRDCLGMFGLLNGFFLWEAVNRKNASAQ